MFQRIIDDIKLSIGLGIRQTSLAGMAAVALFITTSFLCAAAFVAVLDRYGLIEACLAGAGLFFIVTLIAAGTYMVRKRQIERQVKEHAKSAAHAMLADPMVVAAGSAGGARHWPQAADPDPGGRRPGAGPDGRPQRHCGRSDARRIIQSSSSIR